MVRFFICSPHRSFHPLNIPHKLELLLNSLSQLTPRWICPFFLLAEQSKSHTSCPHPFFRKSIIPFMSYLLINYNYIITFLLVERVK